jgi:hypothetical protein
VADESACKPRRELLTWCAGHAPAGGVAGVPQHVASDDSGSVVDVDGGALDGRTPSALSAQTGQAFNVMARRAAPVCGTPHSRSTYGNGENRSANVRILLLTRCDYALILTD